MQSNSSISSSSAEAFPDQDVEPSSGRRFLIKCLIFVGIQAAVLGYLEHLMPRAVKSDEYYRKKDLLESKLPEIEILILGSSQSYHGLNPAHLHPAAFNLAQGGQDLYLDCRLLSNYIDRLSKLRLVLLEVTYFGFQYDLEQTPESGRTFPYRNLHHIPHRDPKMALDLRNFSLLALYGGGSIIRWVVQGSGRGASLMSDQGWQPLVKNADTDALDHAGGVRRIKHLEARMNASAIPRNVAECERLFSELQRRRIPVVLYTPPVHKFLREEMDRGTYDAMQAQIRQFVDKYRLTYLNYIADDRFKDVDFYDCDHLSEAGANKFAEVLRKDLHLE